MERRRAQRYLVTSGSTVVLEDDQGQVRERRLIDLCVDGFSALLEDQDRDVRVGARINHFELRLREGPTLRGGGVIRSMRVVCQIYSPNEDLEGKRICGVENVTPFSPQRQLEEYLEHLKASPK